MNSRDYKTLESANCNLQKVQGKNTRISSCGAGTINMGGCGIWEG